MRVIVTGGGTGGHIYPAIAIADKFKEMVLFPSLGAQLVKAIAFTLFPQKKMFVRNTLIASTMEYSLATAWLTVILGMMMSSVPIAVLLCLFDIWDNTNST